MASIDRSSASPSWVLALAVVVGAVGAVFVVGAGCSYSDSSINPTPDFHDGDANESNEAIVIDVGTDTAAPNPLCGSPTPSCPPDDFDPDAGPHTCTPFDAGADGDLDGGADGGSGDAIVDTAGSGSRNACRVVKVGTETVTACAPAGFGALDSPCGRDADCSPGLTCVGPPTLGRCAPYCCSATPDDDPCHALFPVRYCAPLPLAERPADRVPACIVPDKCTPITNVGCDTDTTCIVVDTYGDTSCVRAGTLADLACCSTDSADTSMLCAQGYACLGPLGDRVCRKLCKVGDTTSCTGSGHCEAQSTFPSGYGICTVDVSDGAADAGHCGS
jgi:hypothetical protein